MALDKNDLKQIRTVVKEEVGVAVTDSEKILRKEIWDSAEETKKELQEEIKSTENRIIAVISREISDLGEINRAVIERVDKISELEKRIIRIEHKIGIPN